MRKKRIRNIIYISLFIVAMVSCGLLGGVAAERTYAYLTTNEGHVNVLSVGDNGTSINEDFSADRMHSGTNTYKKVVKFTNTTSPERNERHGSVLGYNLDRFQRVLKGYNSAGFDQDTRSEFVRVLLEFDDDFVNRRSKLSYDNRTWYTEDQFRQHLPSGWVYIPLSQDPVLGGYYYYTKSIAPGESTTNLITNVQTTFESEAAVKSYNIYVYSESIQVYNKTGVKFNDSDYRAAWTEELSAN